MGKTLTTDEFIEVVSKRPRSNFQDLSAEHIKNIYTDYEAGLTIRDLMKKYRHGESLTRQILQTSNAVFNKQVIIDGFYELGLSILAPEKIKDISSNVDCEDENGYRYFTSLKKLRQSPKTLFIKDVKWKTYNIKRWIALNRPDYRMISAEYRGVGQTYTFEYLGELPENINRILKCGIQHFKNGATIAYFHKEGLGFRKSQFVNKYKDQLTTLYTALCYNTDEKFVKIGITGLNVEDRLDRLPYNYKILDTYINTPELVWSKEKEKHRKLRSYKYQPMCKFQGYTECFSTDALKKLHL